MLDHFAPAVARDDEAGQVATAEAKRAESHHDNELQQLAHRSNSGSLAIFTAIRRASSLVSSLGEGSTRRHWRDRRTGLTRRPAYP